MSLNIKARQDTSFLFSSLSSSRSGSGLGNLNFLADYASIKNGSYGKLMKAYYQKVDNNSDSDSTKTSNSSKLTTSLAADSAKKLTAIDSSADKMKEAADALLETGEDSLFQEKNVTTVDENGVKTSSLQIDKDAAYKGVASFVDSYNKLLTDTAESNSIGITKAAGNMTNLASVYSGSLKDVGITIGTDNKLSIDEEKFKTAEDSKLKSMFNKSNSFAYSMSAQASFVDYAARREQSKANTYGETGNYNYNYSVGNLFNSMF